MPGFRRAIVLCMLPLVTISGCAAQHAARSDRAAAMPPARINHIVLFDLKDTRDAEALIADSRRSLAEIPSVVSLFCGEHVDAGRPGVMTDYDACVYVGFDTLEGYSDYVADPRHQALVARWKHRLVGYRVYDVLDESAE